MSFVWDGEWESFLGTGKTKRKQKKFVFKFNNKNDYKMMIKLLG